MFSDLEKYEKLITETNFGSSVMVADADEPGNIWVMDHSKKMVFGIVFNESDANFLTMGPMMAWNLLEQVKELRLTCNLNGRFPIREGIDPVTCQTLPKGSVRWMTGLVAHHQKCLQGLSEPLQDILTRGGFTYGEMDSLVPNWKRSFEVAA